MNSSGHGELTRACGQSRHGGREGQEVESDEDDERAKERRNDMREGLLLQPGGIWLCSVKVRNES